MHLHKHILLPLFLLVSSLSAQPRPGPEPVPMPGPVIETPRAFFYSEPNFRGECLTVEGEVGIIDLAKVRDSRGHKWDDRIASLRIEGPLVVTLYDDPRYRGERMELHRDVPDFGRLRHGETGIENWDRRVTSLKTTFALPPPAQHSAFFHNQREADRAIRDAYREILGREADYAGLQTYRKRLMDEGWTEEAMRNQLRTSHEFRNRDFEPIIRRCYREILGREPDRDGLNNYTRAMRDRGWTENDLCVDLRRSDEARDRTFTLVITRAYRDLLSREPDRDGLALYLGHMRRGWTEQQVRDDLRRNPAYRDRGRH